MNLENLVVTKSQKTSQTPGMAFEVESEQEKLKEYLKHIGRSLKHEKTDDWQDIDENWNH